MPWTLPLGEVSGVFNCGTGRAQTFNEVAVAVANGVRASRGEAFQHVGFVADLAFNSPWVIVSTGSAGGVIVTWKEADPPAGTDTLGALNATVDGASLRTEIVAVPL